MMQPELFDAPHSTEPAAPCRVIGVLDDGAASLGASALHHIAAADLVIGATRTLQLFASQLRADAEQRDLTGALTQVPEWIRDAQAAGKQVVVLATGDPLCHGIAHFLQSRLCIEAVEVLPNLSTMQLACARVGLAWQDLKIVSVHSRDAGEWQAGAGPDHGLYGLLRALQHHDRLGLFTSPENTPERIARLMQQEGLAEEWRMAVAEHLLQADERVLRDLSIDDAAQLRFADPNIVLLWRQSLRTPRVLFGLDDHAFVQRQPEKGLITKREVRAVSLARMQLRAESIVWDIGAGSGSVGIEASRLAHLGHVYAIEKNRDDHANALANKQQLGAHNYTVIEGKAPAGLEQWPDPDAVFIGGSGGELAELIRLVLSRLRAGGVLVMNFVTFENVALALTTLQQLGASFDITQLQASRSKPILDMHRLAAENPVWVVTATRGESNE